MYILCCSAERSTSAAAVLLSPQPPQREPRLNGTAGLRNVFFPLRSPSTRRLQCQPIMHACSTHYMTHVRHRIRCRHLPINQEHNIDPQHPDMYCDRHCSVHLARACSHNRRIVLQPRGGNVFAQRTCANRCAQSARASRSKKGGTAHSSWRRPLGGRHNRQNNIHTHTLAGVFCFPRLCEFGL